MKQQYDDCFFCGGEVEERLAAHEMHWKGQLLVFENVPMGVCTQCGERFLQPAVAKKIDATLQSTKQPTRMLKVPMYQYLG